MGIIQVISRQVGVGDIAFGFNTFTYVDENGITRTMQQVNATFIPGAVIQDNSGNVTITGDLTVASGAISGYLSVDSGGNIIVPGSANISGNAVIGGSAYITGTLSAGSIPGYVTKDASGNVSMAYLTITSLPAYVNNSAAIAGGLTTGYLYRGLHDPSTDADPAAVCVVF